MKKSVWCVILLVLLSLSLIGLVACGNEEPPLTPSENKTITINEKKTSFEIDETGKFTVTFSVGEADVTWTSDKPEIFEVNSKTGEYKALTPGKFVVTASAEGYKSASLNGIVNTSDVVPQLKVEDLSCWYDDVSYIDPIVTYKGQKVPYNDLKVQYEVLSEDGIITVDADGKISSKEKNAQAEVKVTVIYKGITMEETISVKIQKKTYVTFNCVQKRIEDSVENSCIYTILDTLSFDVNVVDDGKEVVSPDYTFEVTDGEEFIEQDGETIKIIEDGKIKVKVTYKDSDNKEYFCEHEVDVLKPRISAHNLYSDNGKIKCSNEGCSFSCEETHKVTDPIKGYDLVELFGGEASDYKYFVYDGKINEVTDGKLSFSKSEVDKNNIQEKIIQVIKSDLSAISFRSTLYSFIINTEEDLYEANSALLNGDGYIKLNADITMVNGEKTPHNTNYWDSNYAIGGFLGSEGAVFKGIFDGGKYDSSGNLTGNYKISNFILEFCSQKSGQYTNEPDYLGKQWGLFGQINSSAVIKNLDIEMENRRVNVSSGFGGGLIGISSGGLVENVKLYVTTGAQTGADVGGALIGKIDCWGDPRGNVVIKNCVIEGLSSSTHNGTSIAAVGNFYRLYDKEHIVIDGLILRNYKNLVGVYAIASSPWYDPSTFKIYTASEEDLSACAYLGGMASPTSFLEIVNDSLTPEWTIPPEPEPVEGLGYIDSEKYSGTALTGSGDLYLDDTKIGTALNGVLNFDAGFADGLSANKTSTAPDHILKIKDSSGNTLSSAIVKYVNFIVNTEEDLYLVKDKLVNGDGYIKLNSDIKMVNGAKTPNNTDYWDSNYAIGGHTLDYGAAFRGVFDGGKYDQEGNLTGKYKISDFILNICSKNGLYEGEKNYPGHQWGLFGVVLKGAEIKNFDIDMINLRNSENGFIGGLIGKTGGGVTVSNIKLTVDTGANGADVTTGGALLGTVDFQYGEFGYITVKDCTIIGTTEATKTGTSFAALGNVMRLDRQYIIVDNLTLIDFKNIVSSYTSLEYPYYNLENFVMYGDLESLQDAVYVSDMQGFISPESINEIFIQTT